MFLSLSFWKWELKKIFLKMKFCLGWQQGVYLQDYYLSLILYRVPVGCCEVTLRLGVVKLYYAVKCINLKFITSNTKVEPIRTYLNFWIQLYDWFKFQSNISFHTVSILQVARYWAPFVLGLFTFTQKNSIKELYKIQKIDRKQLDVNKSERDLDSNKDRTSCRTHNFI